ncbi:MAG: hypothetical protein J7M18_02835 [Candidatus Eremiobacteraeota bacterium]|nr:hypothetical protein [Candidatus Eremiobacteraeota bacterium]
MLSFCEFLVGSDLGAVCGNRPVGKCIACGLTVCKIHSTLIDGKIFCIDCGKSFGKEKPPSTGIIPQNTPPEPGEVTGLTDFETDRIIFTEFTEFEED